MYLIYVHFSLYFNKKLFKRTGKNGVDDDNFISELFPNLRSLGELGEEKNDVLVESLESFSSRKT